MKPPIYLDHHASTPLEESVRESMAPFLDQDFGNASSRDHRFGWRAESAVEAARESIATLVGATAPEMIFTSGATESNNLALLGLFDPRETRGHIITQATEHLAVLDVVRELGRRGAEVSVLPVSGEGRVDPEDIRRSLRPDTRVVSVMAANNEIGTLQPIDAIGAICKEAGVFFHVDAAQTVGILPVDVQTSGVDLLSFSGHKLYGPKGIGALYVRRRAPRVHLRPLLFGGGHERGLRSGTLNVAGIVGLGAAAKLASQRQAEFVSHITSLRDHLWKGLSERVGGVRRYGSEEHRHPGNLHVGFSGLRAEKLLLGMRHVAVSSGAACSSAKGQPSHVMEAIGVDAEEAACTLRFGVGRGNTAEEIEEVLTCIQGLVEGKGKG